MRNQCDGCRAGLPVDANWNHRMNPDSKSGYHDLMGCQAKKYADLETKALAIFSDDYPPHDEIEKDIQDSFKSSPYPADTDLNGWKRRSGEWQAAWAGAYRRAAEVKKELEALKAAQANAGCHCEYCPGSDRAHGPGTP